MRKSAFIILCLIASGLFVLCSCERESSEDVNQDRIWTEFELFYNENTDITYARAVFRFGNITGTLLELTSPSEVSFNGDLLGFKPTLAYYEKEYAGYVDSGIFTWTDTEGKTITNSVSITEIDYPEAFDTLVRSSAYTFTWQGESLSAGESVILTMNGTLEGDAQIFSQNAVNSTEMILSQDQLNALGHGDASTWLDRIGTFNLEEQTEAGGKVSAKYRPVNKTVYMD
jgi:hypothetical protein